MPRTQITVEDLTLAETAHVEKALEAVQGVHSATAEAGARRVVVDHEESLSRDALLAAIAATGLYPGASAPEPDVRHWERGDSVP